ncbi:multiple inositol polyphosphate phosphatase 1b [Chanos chanos]|uniref:Multiple inositol polyphosphate phosphatase 1 n=1 Tax=Chanos chanos TaxID=29144 RepID=A0A6J2VC10_CHACN|nr:multiple inositol polyphosphate phosphatase 1 [Chanos chanos]
MKSILSNRKFLITALSITLARFSYSQLAKPSVPAIANYFGTKSRYEDVNPHLLDDIVSINKSLLGPPSSNCHAVHLTAVIRHGTRYPTTKNIKRMIRLYDLIASAATSPQPWVREIKTEWKMWYTEDMDGKLVERGRDDHRHLAIRLSKSFPTLISKENLLNNNLKFITSSKHRCIDSIQAFQEGLFGLWNMEDYDFKHTVDDTLMRFFDHCQRFVEDIENSKTALKEVSLFKSSAEMGIVQRKIADKLQLPHSLVTADLVEAAFFLCSYEFAIKSENSPWCNLFDVQDAKVLEYKNDLKQYWKRSYGHDINRKSSCTLFHDLFRRLDEVAYDLRNGQIKKTATIQVGHAETLLPLLTLFGFFRDNKPLTAEDFSQQQNRTFRTSQIVPYAANLVFVLYDCSDGLRLQFLLNEKPMAFPDISTPTPLYDTVRKHYKELLDGCNFEKECASPKANFKNSEL